MSAELAAQPMTEGEARRITERIRAALDRVSTAWSDLAERVAEAYDRRADLALGYGSWAEYAEAELKPSGAIAAEVRRELVGLLSARGMSTRAIAPVAGVTRQGVSKALKKVATELPPEPFTPDYEAEAAEASAEVIDYATGEVVEPVDLDQWRHDQLAAAEAEHRVVKLTGSDSIADPPKVTGLDGKTYSRPTPSAPTRRPLREGFRDAALDLDKVIGRFDRLISDDRYPKNREEVARYANDLIRAREALDRLIGQMSN